MTFKNLLLSGICSFLLAPPTFLPQPKLILPMKLRPDGQELVKQCLNGNVGIWIPEKTIDYCLSLVGKDDH